MTSWTTLSERASLASHRLIGWIYWDPFAIELYKGLGVPDGFGYYIASRCAPLGAAGPDVVTAACYSIRQEFVAFSLQLCAEHASFEDAYRIRNEAVVHGLTTYAPEVIAPLGEMAESLWTVAESLPIGARTMYAAHKSWPRCEDSPALSAWLALNCIREWRGDTHWAVLAAEALSGVEAGLLHDAYLGYPGEWIPRSRGAEDAAIDEAWQSLERRGFVTNRRINDAGMKFREDIELRTNVLCELPWRRLGEDATRRFVELIEPLGTRFLERINETAGHEWMPAARDRRPRH